MRKLSLEELEVLSFETDGANEPKGTVQANELDLMTGTRPTCLSCLTNLTCCTPLL